jgi:hypothetical protein
MMTSGRFVSSVRPARPEVSSELRSEVAAVPYTEQHMYMTVIGDCYNAAERWQFGLRLTDGGISQEATALAISDDVERWWTVAAPYSTGVEASWLSTHRLVELKVARIQPDGKYPPDEEAYSHFYLPPIVGTITPTTRAIPQTTVCATLTTAKPRGLASKGRVYLPPPQGWTVGADGRMAPSEAMKVAASIKRLINEINANELVGNVAIFSRGTREATFNPTTEKVEYTYPNPGATELVTGVNVGTVVDTQRRRRRQLVEDRQVAAL